jgi:glycerol kinase
MSDEPTLLTIDQGTTSSRAILFSKDGDILFLLFIFRLLPV